MRHEFDDVEVQGLVMTGFSDMQHYAVTTTMPTDMSCRLNGLRQVAAQLYKDFFDARIEESPLPKAYEVLTQAAELDPDCPIIAGKLARVQLLMANAEKAERFAHQALDLDAANVDALHVLGVLHCLREEWALSRNYLVSAIVASPLSTAATRLELAKTYRLELEEHRNLLGLVGSFMLSTYHTGVAFSLAPFCAEFLWVRQVLCELPKALVRRRLSAKAPGEAKPAQSAKLAMLFTLHRKHPGCDLWAEAIADAHVAELRLQEATYWLRKTIARRPLHLAPYLTLVDQLEALGEVDEALAIYESLIRLCPNEGNLRCRMGNLCYRYGRYEQALGHYKAALQLGGNDDHWSALVARSIGNLYLEEYQNLQAAQMAFAQAVQLAPDDVENYIQLGLVTFEMDDFANAAVIYEQAIARHSQDARLYTNLGYLRWLAGDNTQAAELYKKALALDPYYAVAHNNLGVLEMDSFGNVLKALQHFRMATQLNEHYTLAFYNLGRAHSLQNDPISAAHCFQIARQLNGVTHELDDQELDTRIQVLFDTRWHEAG